MADFFYCNELSWFEFPVNLLGGIVLVAGCVALQLFYGEKRWVKKFTGVGFALGWMALLILLLLTEGIFSCKLYHSWFFVVLWLVFLCHLGMVVIRRLHPWNAGNVFFLLNHFGVWLAVAASFLGAPDVKISQMSIPLGKAEDRTIDERGEVHPLDFSVVLRKFSVGYPERVPGVPENFRAELFLQGKEKEKQVNLEVNKPVSFEGYTFYLERYAGDEEEVREVVLQLVRDPWRGAVYAGIMIMLAGSLGLIFRASLKRKGDKCGLE